jgi:serine/threonine protein kinase
LRSVEVVPGQGGTANSCPYCGGPIDSELVEADPRTRTSKDPGGSGDVGLRMPESEPTSDWAGTWSRGSLGSLGRFQLRERLGDGGFGEVFLAFDPRLDRDVALKVLKQTNPTERVMERFFREARAAARLDHPNIVAVHDAGFDNGRCWVAFHYVSGRPLGWYRDHHRLDPSTAARILRDLADAVDHAHHQGVLHRDIKPANVLIDDHGRPRLIDFGLARRSDVDSSLTREGAVVGTPAYMSPEQALGFSRQVDERSDVFSLGVIFFETLTGQRPYSTAELSDPSENAPRPGLDPRGHAPPPSARSINPAVPMALDRICMRAIAQNPQDRYASARDLADDLDQWLLRHKSGNLRLSFTVSTTVMGLAAALLLVIGIRVALLPWNEWARHRTFEGILPQALSRSQPAPVDSRDGQLEQTRAVSPAAKRPPAPPPGTESPAPVQLIGNARKGLYHLSTCPDVRAMNPSNQVHLKDVDQAAAQGLRPCGHCHPPVAAARVEGDAGG